MKKPPSLEKYNKPGLFQKIFASWAIAVVILISSFVIGPMLLGHENFSKYVGSNLVIIGLIVTVLVFPLVNSKLK